MDKNSKRLWSIFLVLCMVAGMLPTISVMRTGQIVEHAEAASLADYEQFEVEADDPANVTMHLFDYWVKNDRKDPDTTGEAEDATRGINKGHVLRFRSGVGMMDSEMTLSDTYNADDKKNEKLVLGNLNHGTSERALDMTHPILRPRQGVVKPTLGADGYPHLAGENPSDAFDSLRVEDANISPQMFEGFNWTGSHWEGKSEADLKNESLRYLFDPNVKHEGKESFKNVTGLFQQDDQGYYYYNSMGEARGGYIQTQKHFADANYAYFDEEEGRFRLYSESAVGSDEGFGQFFPFDRPDEVFDSPSSGAGTLNANKNIRMNSRNLNHYFGMYLEIPFVQAANGQIYYNGKAQDTIFNFSGDDDLWLFVDDVLVGDVGGIHGASTLDINFAKGTVVVNRDEGDIKVPGTQETTLKEIYKDAGRELAPRDSDAVTYADGSRHTIRVFYMERGNSASNLGIKFNLSATPTSKLEKFNENGEPLANAVFDIYQADKDVKGNYTIKKDANGKETAPLYSGGTTDENGVFNIVDGKNHPILLNTLPGDYFILREIKTPAGYRSGGDIHLRKHQLGDGSITLVTDEDSPTGGKWSTGSYASAVENTNVADKDVYLREETPPYEEDTYKQVVKDGDLVGLNNEEGTMFAVILKWTADKRPEDCSPEELNNHYNGTPVYGNPEDGYKLAELKIPDNATPEQKKAAGDKAVMQALLENPYLFQKDDTGRYSVTIDNMPGDITQYMHAGADKNLKDLHYTIMYGWTDMTQPEIANKKKNDGTPITADNAGDYRFYRLYSEDFSRTFAVTFRAVNIKDDFEVHKLDEKGTPMEGAEFSLYKKADVELKKDGRYVIDSQAASVDVGITDAKGNISFPTDGKSLSVGEYCLIETKSPKGYEPLSDVVHIIVDGTGVYADAGTKDDGISVEQGVGNLVETMHEFAVDNDIDETLHNIIYTPQTGSLSDGKLKWEDKKGVEKVHLSHHGYGHAIDDHTGYVNDKNQGVNYTAEQGWSKLLIQQCPDHRNSSVANKENLGTKDISNLFTRDVEVIIRNYPIAADVKLGGVKKLQKEEGIHLTHERNLKAEEFEFKLEPIGDAPMPDDSETFTVKNTADGEFAFPKMRIDKAGEYQYKITEIKGKDTTIRYDDSYWLVSVKVTKDEAIDDLISEVDYTKYSKDGKTIPTTADGEFTNTYNEIDPISPDGFDDSDKPEDPTGPSNPSAGNETGEDDASDTGDHFNIMLWLVLTTVAAIVTVALVFRRKEAR